MDGNESYSSLLHAYNLYHFDTGKTFWLADEAASPDPEAHPFIHTHQGNFPRLFAYLIYLMGARTIESQITVTTFTVGLAAVLFGFVFFCRIASPLFALTVSLLMITDYLLFTQWQVVTYRVWYAFFVFSSLLCAQGIGGPRRRLWIVLTFLNHMCLFYFELVFVFFVAVMTGLYTGWAYRKNWKTMALGWSAQLAGAVTGLSILAIQLIFYLGWADFLQDLYLTFVARNYASGDPHWLDKLTDFYNTRNIVFWYNLESPDKYAGFGASLSALFTYSFSVHTPFLTLTALLLFVGWLLGTVAHWIGQRPLVPVSDSGWGFDGLIASAFLFAFGLYLFVLTVIIADSTLAGAAYSDLSMPPGTLFVMAGLVLLLLLVSYLTIVLVRFTLRSSPIVGCSSAVNVFVAGLYLIGAASFISFQSRLYNQDWRILWLDTLGPSNHWLAVTVVCVAAGFGLLLILMGPERLLRKAGIEIKGLCLFLIAGLIAFGVVYKLAPGYVHTGYLTRYTPLIVFHVDSLMAVSLFILLSAGHTAYDRLKIACSLQQAALVRTWGRQPAALLIGALGLAGYFLVYWVNLQVSYIELFPYDRFSFMKMLKEPPYRGASFVVNNYAIPTFTFTGQWAYLDAKVGQRRLALTPEGFTMQRDLRALWLADRHERLDYLKPDYFLCFRALSVELVAARLLAPDLQISGCGELGLVRQASSNTRESLQHRLVARDDSHYDSWAVVKLDWDFPPFLKPLSPKEAETAVELKVTHTPAGSVAEVNYLYTHQEALREGDTRVRLFRMEAKREDGAVSEGARQRTLLDEGIRRRRFPLPSGFEGFLQATVAPATATKTGPEYSSPLVWASAEANRSGHGKSLKLEGEYE